MSALTITLAHAQAYPQRPVRLNIANGAGSAPDVIGRLLANKLAESRSQPVTVDNRPGATGLIAVGLIARSAPDGHTVFLTTMTQLIAMLMYQKHMLATELGAIALVGTTPFAIIVGLRLPSALYRFPRLTIRPMAFHGKSYPGPGHRLSNPLADVFDRHGGRPG